MKINNKMKINKLIILALFALAAAGCGLATKKQTAETYEQDTVKYQYLTLARHYKCEDYPAEIYEEKLLPPDCTNNPFADDKDNFVLQTQRYYSFKNISEITTENIYSVWVEIKDSIGSLALIFNHKADRDTLTVYYSSECWLFYPYKLEGNKIVVYWDTIIDTKYQFDIVKAIRKIDKNLIGKPFMILKLENDTTLKATYPMKNLIKKINHSSEHKHIFFPDTFRIAPEDYWAFP
jgi:hypothetical protein